MKQQIMRHSLPTILWFLIVVVWKICYVSSLQDISTNELDKYLQDEQWYRKACIFYYGQQDNTNSNSMKQFDSTFLKLNHQMKNASDSVREDISFYKYHDKSGQYTTPIMRCFLKTSSPKEFKFDANKSLLKWLKNKIFNHDVEEEIHFLRTRDINEVAANQQSSSQPSQNHQQQHQHQKDVLICFTTTLILPDMVKLFTNVKKLHSDVSVYFVPPGTQLERSLLEEHNVAHFPSVMFFQKTNLHQRFERWKLLSGMFEVTEKFVALALLVNVMKDVHLHKNTFELNIRRIQHARTPSVITVYSSANPDTYNYLHAFYRSCESIQRTKKAKLFVLDISNQENAIVLTKYLKIHTIRKVPFTLAIFQNQSDPTQMEQVLLQTNGTPTPHVLQMFLHQISDDVTHAQKGTSRLLQLQNALNATDVCVVDHNVCDGRQYKRQPATILKTKRHRKPSRRKHNVLKEVTKDTWDHRVLGRNEHKMDLDAFTENVDFNVKFVLIVFIRADCSYCTTVHPEFVRVAQSASFIDNFSVFLVNCSNSKEICDKYHVTGYPTLLLFRTIQAENSEHCIRAQSLVEPSWIDYHGDYYSSAILNWVSDVIRPNMQIKPHVPKNFQTKNIHLIVKLYTKQYVSQSLPRSLSGKLLHLSCLSMLCELLHAQVECFGVAEEGVTINYRDKNLFVSSVEFRRQDGVRAMLMKTGYPMDRAIAMEDEQSREDVFHEGHRYDIPPGFSCEDDNVRCVQVIKRFIEDHARLPVTQVTQQLFHTHKRGRSYMWDRPILLALAHHANLTDDAPFNTQLYNIAVRLYNKVNVAVLDVDVHSYWSKLFVPRGYYLKYEASSSTHEIPLEQYPRFCLLHLDDHSHAAFYPRFNDIMLQANQFQGHVTTILDSDSLTAMVDEYLSDRSLVVMETEHF